MITDNDIKKLKTVFATKEDLKRFATKEDLDESEARTAFGFADVQRQFSEVRSDISELKSNVSELKTDVKEMRQEMNGMERNIIQAIQGIRDEQEVQEKQIIKLNKAVFSN